MSNLISCDTAGKSFRKRKAGQMTNARNWPMKSTSVLTAAKEVKEAFVSNQLKHSYLIYALVEEGFKSSAAAHIRQAGLSLCANGSTTRRAPKLRGDKLPGKDITEEGGDAPTNKPVTRPTRAQTPRVFYRREPLYARPLVIAHLDLQAGDYFSSKGCQSPDGMKAAQ